MNDEQKLTEIQTRVLGCLVEKEAATPDQYPLTLNALVSACNQKTSRVPVTDYQPGQIGHALRELEGLDLIREVHGARAMRYEHRLLKGYSIFTADLAVLCVLMLRGAQTAAEIRTRCQRIHEFDDVDDVEYILKRLIDREPALAMQIPRQPGQKEDRYHHLLAGEPDLSAIAATTPAATSRANLEQRVAALEGELAELQQRLAILEQ